MSASAEAAAARMRVFCIACVLPYKLDVSSARVLGARVSSFVNRAYSMDNSAPGRARCQPGCATGTGRADALGC